MDNTINIPIHSVIDVITNSSTEIFVSATQSSIRLIKEIITMIYGENINIESNFKIYISDESERECGECEEGCNSCYANSQDSWVSIDFLTDEAKSKMDLIKKILRVPDSYYRDEYYC